jgi:hypothetical protein
MTVVYLRKSDRPGKKFMVSVDGKVVHFGAAGMSDYTKHKDKERMRRYLERHGRGRENWKKSGISTPGFWSRWLLWNKPSISASRSDISKRFGVKFGSGWPKNNIRKSVRKSRKPKRKSARKSRKSVRKSARKSRKPKRKSARKVPFAMSRTKPKKKIDGRRGGPKYESCVLKIKMKQPKKCFKDGAWVGGKGCYNPWAICTKTVGRNS